MEYAYQNSTIAQILEAIINESTFEGESNSNIGDILLSILNKTPYTEPPKSVIADLLLRVKAKIEGESFEPYEGDHISRIADILISILNETEYTEAPQSRIAELLLELKEELEAYTELTASGTVASFVTNVVKPLVNGEFSIQAYQEGSGDPSPVNIRNIVGYSELNMYKTGENQFNIANPINNFYLSELGTIEPFTGWNLSDYQIVKPNTTYHFKPNSTSGGSAKHGYYNKNKQFIGYISSGEITFTTPNDAYYMRFSYRNVSTDITLNFGSTAQPYKPYVTSEIKTKQLGETVYGGSYNSVMGKKIKTHGVVILNGSENWDMTSTAYRLNLTSPFALDPNYDSYIILMANEFKYRKVNTSSALNDNDFTWFRSTSNIFVKWNWSGEHIVDDFKNFLSNNNLIILGQLATPIETDIGATPIETYDGSNNIFCDTGDTSVTYLYKGTPPETLNRVLSKGVGENNDIMKEGEIEKPINEEVNENEK